MAKKYLGDEIDIHAGGEDLIFPHHENEIAQSEAYLGHPWCKYWFHVLHLLDARGKMSKSKGDFLTVSLLEEKGYAPLVYRMFCLQSHYRKPLTFSFESLDNTATAYKKLVSRVAALKNEGEHDEAAMEPLRASFRAALENDLNTSLALTALYDVLKAKLSDADKLALIKEFDEVLSLGLLKAAKALREEQNAQKSAVPEGMTAEEAAEIEALIAKRTEARKAKDWATADAIRDALAARHIVVKDTPQGIAWSVQG